jgi:predicted nucleic acid-binding protein
LVRPAQPPGPVNLLNARAGHAAGGAFLERLRSSSAVSLHHIGPREHREAEEFFARRPDKEFSLTDCSSFVVMGGLGLREAFAFDGHFLQAGFRLIPG